MPQFHILPNDQAFSSAEIVTADPAEVLRVVQRLASRDADVLRNGLYAYSIRLDDNGLWCLYQRDQPEPEPEVQALAG